MAESRKETRENMMIDQLYAEKYRSMNEQKQYRAMRRRFLKAHQGIPCQTVIAGGITYFEDAFTEERWRNWKVCWKAAITWERQRRK